MVLKVHHLEGCHFPMIADIHRYFHHMDNRSHSAGFSVHEINLPWFFCIDHFDPVFFADFAVDKVLCCSLVDHCIDCDYSFFSVELYLDHDVVFVFFECLRVVECRVIFCRDNGFSFWSVPQPISYCELFSFPDSAGIDLISISLICWLACHGTGFLFGCQGRACGSNGLGVILHLAAWCPGFPHLRHSCSFIRLWNSSLEMLGLGCLRVTSKFIGSP